MADKNLAQNIDKISYGVAAVLALALLALPFLSGGDLDEKRDGLTSAIRTFVEKAEERVPDNPVAELEGILEKQWDPARSSVSPTWLTERAPALSKVVRAVQRVPAVHGRGVITEVACSRDAEKQQSYVVVTGAMAEGNANVLIEEVRLYRKTGEDGEFVRLDLEADGDFEYQDFDVEPGKVYTYKFVSKASRDPNAGPEVLDPESATQESTEVGPTPPVPYDFSFKVGQIIAAKPGEPPKVIAQFRYYDYDSQQIEIMRTTFPEKQIIGAGMRYKINRVDDGQRTVEILDKIRRARYRLSRKDEVFPVDCWESLSGIEPESGDDDDDDDATVEPEPELEPEPAEEAPAGDTGGRTPRRGFK